MRAVVFTFNKHIKFERGDKAVLTRGFQGCNAGEEVEILRIISADGSYYRVRPVNGRGNEFDVDASGLQSADIPIKILETVAKGLKLELAEVENRLAWCKNQKLFSYNDLSYKILMLRKTLTDPKIDDQTVIEHVKDLLSFAMDYPISDNVPTGQQAKTPIFDPMRASTEWLGEAVRLTPTDIEFARTQLAENEPMPSEQFNERDLGATTTTSF